MKVFIEELNKNCRKESEDEVETEEQKEPEKPEETEKPEEQKDPKDWKEPKDWKDPWNWKDLWGWKAPTDQTVSGENANSETKPANPARTAAGTDTKTAAKSAVTVEAVYLGVKDYGTEGIDKDHKDSFLYRFEVEGTEKIYKIDNGAKDAEGNYAYPIQNLLKEGYRYRLTLDNDTVIAVEELDDALAFSPVVQGTPGEGTLKNFLMTALEPVGTTLYIYGGGWDWQDLGSAVLAKTLGVSSDWVRFFESQDESFTYKEKDGDEAKKDPVNSYYPYGEYNEYYYAGLDCSGYVGWAVYNAIETENGLKGYVSGATGMAKKLADQGWGTWTHDLKAPDGNDGSKMKPGDIISIDGHVWISLGTCEDGSVLILHSTPSMSRTGQPGGGVQISAVGTSEDCEAYQLADAYMSKYYPVWYERYPAYLCDPARYFTAENENAGRFTWDTESDGAVLGDPNGLKDMEPAEVLKVVFGE